MTGRGSVPFSSLGPDRFYAPFVPVGVAILPCLDHHEVLVGILRSEPRSSLLSYFPARVSSPLVLVQVL